MTIDSLMKEKSLKLTGDGSLAHVCWLAGWRDEMGWMDGLGWVKTRPACLLACSLTRSAGYGCRLRYLWLMGEGSGSYISLRTIHAAVFPFELTAIMTARHANI